MAVRKLFIMVFGCVVLFFAGNEVFAVNITTTTSYVSRYIWRGQDLSYQNDPVVQSSVDVAFPKLIEAIDVSMNVWNSTPLKDGHVTTEELDYSLTLSRSCMDKVKVTSGYVYFDYPRLDQYSDINEVWGSLTWCKIPYLPIDISATVLGAYEFEAASDGPENGWYYSWGFNTVLPLPDCKIFQNGQNISLGLTNWGNDGVGGLKPSRLYATDLSATTSYSFKKFTITPGFYYTINHVEQINSGDSELWGSISVSYAF
ncbi:MAG: hypothetical protein ABIG92_06695 [Candidatus Omnitrophota bacterium]